MRRERIVLPGEKHPPAAWGPTIVFEVHRIRQLVDDAGAPAIALDLRQKDGSRMTAVMAAEPYLDLSIKLLGHHGYRLIPIATNPVTVLLAECEAAGYVVDGPLKRKLDQVAEFLVKAPQKNQGPNPEVPDGAGSQNEPG